jgi:hypothetical protein
MLYRVPFVNIRWIDVAILMVVGVYVSDLIRNRDLVKKNGLLISLCFTYLLFETFQFASTWQVTDTAWQISGFICTLGFFIIIDLSTFIIPRDEIFHFLEQFSLWGSITLIITNAYLFYSFITGTYVVTDLDTRVAIEVVGAKETVSTAVLTPFVYAFGLYFFQKETKFWKKLVYITAILTIFISLVITFHRGTLLTVILLSIIYLAIFSKSPYEVFSKICGFAFLICLCYFLFGSILREKGYDPVDKLWEVAQFTVDIDNPDWSKGRNIPIDYALAAWKTNLYTGVGYNDLYHYGLPAEMGSAHNFIAASLFHRGIIGTAIYLIILFILFRNSIKLFSQIRGKESFSNDLLKLLIAVCFFWLIAFWTQDVIWEKYSLSIEFIYLGVITNLHRQKAEKES